MTIPENPWGYAANDGPEEGWHTASSRDDAITKGRESFGLCEAFYIIQGSKPGPRAGLPDAEDICTQMAEWASDNGAPEGHEHPDVSNEAGDDLDALLCAWADKHVKASFWIGDGTPERIESTQAYTDTRPCLWEPKNAAPFDNPVLHTTFLETRRVRMHAHGWVIGSESPAFELTIQIHSLNAEWRVVWTDSGEESQQ